MTKYNSKGDAGVVAYEVVENGITIKFKGGDSYMYNYQAPGKFHVMEMLRLAEAGKGLSTYINQYVRDNYFKKL